LPRTGRENASTAIGRESTVEIDPVAVLQARLTPAKRCRQTDRRPARTTNCTGSEAMRAAWKMTLGLALLIATFQSQAAVILYTNELSYLAAVGATRTYIDFAGSPNATVSGSTFSGDVTFGSCTDSASAGSCGTQVLHASDGITDLGGSSASNGVASVAWRFNLLDVLAFAFNYESGAIDSLNLVDTSLNLTALDTTSASGFIGLVSDAPFYGAIAVNAVTPGVGNDRYFIADFRINEPGSVPEPGALALVIAAFAAATLALRRRTGLLRARTAAA
jgi:hypothetical protein